jgi:nuclear migration protein JNM1
MDHLMTLLTQPRHLDAISRRIKLLLKDLDRAHTSSKSGGSKRQSMGGDSGGAGLGLLSPNLPGGPSLSPSVGGAAPAGETTLTPAQGQKLDQVFQLIPRLQPLLPLLPHLLARLRSLSDLHESAATFDETLRRLEQSSARLASAHQETETVIDRLDSSIRGNEEMIEANFRALGGRVGDIRRRLAALDGGEAAES